MPAPTPRLIEDWLPINEISVEAIREGVMSALPPVNYLHVWWARRPLVASRAAIAASLLDMDADRDAFTAALGTYPEIVQDQAALDAAKARGEKLKPPVYVNPRRPLGKDNHPRAFAHNLTQDERKWFKTHLAVDDPLVLDVTAGGGSIPFEAGRLGLRSVANELNPVAAIILRATCELPQKHGKALLAEFQTVAKRFRNRVRELLNGVYPENSPFEENFFETPEIKKSRIARAQRDAQTYLWARAIRCPSCGRMIPLSPNWRLSSKRGIGVRLIPDEDAGTCGFEIVTKASEQSPGTIKGGIAVCPYPSCGDSAPRGYPAAEARAGRMGHILYCVVYRNQIYTYTKAGEVGKRPKTIRTFTIPRPKDRDMTEVHARLAALKPKWHAEDVLPSEEVPPNGNKTKELHSYGTRIWADMFNPRQQLVHGYCVQAFRELVDADEAAGELSEIRRAAWLYAALALDGSLVNRNNLLAVWDPGTERIAHTFAQHDFGMKWSYAEMTATIEGLGLDWVLRNVAKCVNELIEMAGHPEPSTDKSVRSDAPQLMNADAAPDCENPSTASPTVVTVYPAQDLDMPAASVDAIIFDPPYHDNVNYAELSDFFYVWLKRTAGHVYPDLCRAYLSDKVNEAIASPARFRDAATKARAASNLATADYYEKMADIFAECRRVIKKDGVMTVMFTHKSADAWDALITALIESGFQITRTWPVKTESEASIHIRGKAAARTTILLVCRPMSPNEAPAAWHVVESIIEREVREDIGRLGALGLKPVDMYLAAFGPALRVISEHWGTEREAANPERPEDEFAVTPTDAMQVARREVSRHRLSLLSERFTRVSDPAARFYVLASDASAGDTMDYDEALLLARAAGYDINAPEARSVLAKSGNKITLKTAQDRLAEDDINPNRAALTPLDQVHTAIALTARQHAAAARDWLTAQAIDVNEDRFKGTLEALHAAQKPGAPDNAPARALYTLLYSQEPPRQGGLL